MNAKFRMPKFGRDVKWLAMLKELLMTVFATTVSITRKQLWYVS